MYGLFDVTGYSNANMKIFHFRFQYELVLLYIRFDELFDD